MIVSLGICDSTVLASDKYHYAATVCGCIVLKFFLLSPETQCERRVCPIVPENQCETETGFWKVEGGNVQSRITPGFALFYCGVPSPCARIGRSDLTKKARK